MAQESFWQAYRNRSQLRELDRLPGWLCGIARNLAHQSLKGHRPSTISWEEGSHDTTAPNDDPVLDSISKEESQLVWSALEDIPEKYREALVLFYRQGQSVQEMAEALDISLDAAKQRLSRGRDMMRSQLAITVEGVLQRSRPSTVFTAKVMAGIALDNFLQGGGRPCKRRRGREWPDRLSSKSLWRLAQPVSAFGEA